MAAGSRARLGETLHRIRSWQLDQLECERLRRNVQATYKRGRKMLETTVEKTSTKNIHAFRKRAKELWYQLRLLRPLSPVVFEELDNELATIGECLGQLHDLAFLVQSLHFFGAADNDGERMLKSLIARCTDEL